MHAKTLKEIRHTYHDTNIVLFESGKYSTPNSILTIHEMKEILSEWFLNAEDWELDMMNSWLSDLIPGERIIKVIDLLFSRGDSDGI